MKHDELMQHYDFYVDNCTKDEIPISLAEWERDYAHQIPIIMDSL